MALSKRILVVEDDQDIREILAELLESEGYRVLTAENGREAIELLDTKPGPCLILLDLFMPVMNGVEFLTELRRLHGENKKDLAVVVVSAVPRDGDVAKLIKPMTAGFIPKPINLDALLGTVQKYCAKAS